MSTPGETFNILFARLFGKFQSFLSRPLENKSFYLNFDQTYLTDD